MHSELPREIPRPPALTKTASSVVAFDGVSKWYGNVIGVNKLTLHVPAGVTGLLGPNGAGKSTLLQLATGQLRPSQGSVRVLGQPAWNNPALNRRIGLCPEQDAFYEWMTGWDFVHTSARLAGMNRREAKDAAARAIESVGMTRHKDRVVRGYSKGMRQRTKLAQSLVHDPEVLFLDEPMTGTDPVARRDLMDVIARLAADGPSVLVSTHVLHEIASLTSRIVLMNRGRLVAEGEIRQIRDLIDKHPHHIVLMCDESRRLAARVVEWPDVEGVSILPGDKGVVVETRAPDAFYGRLPDLALSGETPIREVYSEDDSLEAVFKYLVNK